MKIGDLVEHKDGTTGLVIAVNADATEDEYPYRVWFFTERENRAYAEWFVPYVFEIVNESR